MRIVIQRVSSASVRVDGIVVSHVDRGLLVLAGVMTGDGLELDVWPVAEKLAGLRIFSDDHGKLNRSLADVGGSILVVSQFTLAGNLSRGRRPEFLQAEEPGRARELIGRFVMRLRELGCRVEEGVFGAHMEVELVNDGPVTLLLDSQSFRSATPV